MKEEIASCLKDRISIRRTSSRPASTCLASTCPVPDRRARVRVHGRDLPHRDPCHDHTSSSPLLSLVRAPSLLQLQTRFPRCRSSVRLRWKGERRPRCPQQLRRASP